MQKKRKNETGLRTPEDQAAGPTHIPSELLDIAPCQAETIFTYLYICLHISYILRISIYFYSFSHGFYSFSLLFVAILYVH